MNIQDIRDMFEYNYWANYLLLDKAAALTPEQFIAPSTHSFSTVQATLLHTLDTEWSWRELLQGHGFVTELKVEDFPTVESIRQHWVQDEQAMWDWINNLTEADLTTVFRYTGDTGIKRERLIWHCLFHVVNHGMQHRSEVAAMLTDFGQSPGEIDFTIFLNDRNKS